MQPRMLLDAAHKIHLMHFCSKNGRAGKYVNHSWDAHVTLMRLKIPISCKVLFLQGQCGDTSLAVGQKLQHMSAGVSATPLHAAITLMPESILKSISSSVSNRSKCCPAHNMYIYAQNNIRHEEGQAA